MKKLVARMVLATSVLAAFVGVFALSVATSSAIEAKGKPCGPCPNYCIEVTCEDGHTYCNACYAACAGQRNCHTGV